MESSRRDLLNGMAEHGPILKNNQNTYHPRFGFTPKTGVDRGEGTGGVRDKILNFRARSSSSPMTLWLESATKQPVITVT